MSGASERTSGEANGFTSDPKSLDSESFSTFRGRFFAASARATLDVFSRSLARVTGGDGGDGDDGDGGGDGDDGDGEGDGGDALWINIA